MNHTTASISLKQPQAYSLPNALSGDAPGAVRYNQLLDMYALQLNQQRASNSFSQLQEGQAAGADPELND